VNSSNGPAFVVGVNHALHAIREGMRTGSRAPGQLFHPFEPGSPDEHSFDQGAQFAATKALGGAEFALQVKSDSDRKQSANN
jgi:hypothetical protein